MSKLATAARPADSAAAVPYQTFDLPVPGGTLHGGVWGTKGPIVFCSHGVTANHMAFAQLADELGGECRLIAPDHRGRGRSHAITGPWGFIQHGADAVAVMNHFRVPRVEVYIGQSMGGFIAAVAAAGQPKRIGNVLMLDGGIPLVTAPWLPYMPFADWIIERLVLKIVGPSIKRLDMTFKNREEYFEFWKQHPALKDEWSEYIERYAAYELVGDGLNLKSSMSKHTLLADSMAQVKENAVPGALKKIECPIRFLRAPRGVMNAAPVYDAAKLARATAKLRTFSLRNVEGVNHFTLLMSERGVKVVADEVRKMLKDV